MLLDVQATQAGEVTAIPTEMRVRIPKSGHERPSIPFEEPNIWVLEYFILVGNLADCFYPFAWHNELAPCIAQKDRGWLSSAIFGPAYLRCTRRRGMVLSLYILGY
jgi:hypothetical protein